MEFKKIQLTGFKSFAEKTNFLIEEGLTGIVGPNGCGKSNIVESLRWCMGETSAKSMRGSGMEDVIFSGTSNKPSKNIAEVSIALSNENKDGPIQYNELDEIEIRRKIEKDKGSKFYINNKEVRAKDAQMFFADLSTGAHSPSLISQGRIGALVTAKPADRRAILEEAAGIAGLHVRRHEAELRLSAAENNLKRADELRRQQERQLANLQKQAEEASSACFCKFASCLSCCLLNSSALFKLFSAALNLSSASCLLTCKPAIPAASSSIALLSAGFAVTKAPIRSNWSFGNSKTC